MASQGKKLAGFGEYALMRACPNSDSNSDYATESMLLWDERKGEYDADATPGYGEETLRDFYVRVLEEGLAGQSLGDQALF